MFVSAIVWPELVPFVVLGLLGSLHCAGMCGGFAIAVANCSVHKTRLVALSRQLTYIVGKALAYVVLALLVATGSFVLRGRSAVGGDTSEFIVRLQFLAQCFVGFVLIAMGCRVLGMRLPNTSAWEQAIRKAIAPLKTLFAGARSLPGHTGALCAGVLNGLLPCGLSWSAFLLASQTTPLTAAMGAFLFGIMTGPVLVLCGLAPQFLSKDVQVRAQPLLGGALIVFGALAILRGEWFPRYSSGPSAPCCQELLKEPDGGP